MAAPYVVAALVVVASIVRAFACKKRGRGDGRARGHGGSGGSGGSYSRDRDSSSEASDASEQRSSSRKANNTSPPTARETLGDALLAALPWLLLLSFLVTPVVSSTAFRAFDCERFDDEIAAGHGHGQQAAAATAPSFLRADYAVECGTAAHNSAKASAWVALLLYPVGVRVGIVAHGSTALGASPSGHRRASLRFARCRAPPSLLPQGRSSLCPCRLRTRPLCVACSPFPPRSA